MSDHFYVADAETATEMARLLEQDRLLTDRVSGLLPPDVAPETVQDVLDLGCGPGGWVLQLAKTYPHIQVHGIDHSHLMIAYARAKAEQEGVQNAQYHVMDFQSLASSDASFDLVNARVVQWFIPHPRRLPIAQEWLRVLRPGGVMRLIEWEFPLTTSSALERLAGRFLEALSKEGRAFIAGGRQAGSTLIPGYVLRSLGCQEIQEQGHAINFSRGLPAYEAGKHDGLRWLETCEPFLLQAGVVSQQDFAALAQQVRQELEAADFMGLIFYLSAWGRKPLDAGS